MSDDATAVITDLQELIRILNAEKHRLNGQVARALAVIHTRPTWDNCDPYEFISRIETILSEGT